MDIPLTFRHECERCGKVEDITSEEAFNTGWDYPPRMGAFGVISARTCGSCGIEGTAWWALAIERMPFEELTEQQQATVERIRREPFIFGS